MLLNRPSTITTAAIRSTIAIGDISQLLFGFKW